MFFYTREILDIIDNEFVVIYHMIISDYQAGSILLMV